MKIFNMEKLTDRIYKYLQKKKDWVQEDIILKNSLAKGYSPEQINNAYYELKEMVDIAYIKKQFKYISLSKKQKKVLTIQLEGFNEL